MEFEKAIRMAVDTGKTEFGSRRAISLALSGSAKLFVVAVNAPASIKRDIESNAKASNIPVKIFKGSSVELGSVCGVPHPIAVLSVLEPGNSTILQEQQ